MERPVNKKRIKRRRGSGKLYHPGILSQKTRQEIETERESIETRVPEFIVLLRLYINR